MRCGSCQFDGIEAENPYMRQGARDRLTEFLRRPP